MGTYNPTGMISNQMYPLKTKKKVYTYSVFIPIRCSLRQLRVENEGGSVELSWMDADAISVMLVL